MYFSLCMLTQPNLNIDWGMPGCGVCVRSLHYIFILCFDILFANEYKANFHIVRCGSCCVLQRVKPYSIGDCYIGADSQQLYV
jgi:hypothetical protein